MNLFLESVLRRQQALVSPSGRAGPKFIEYDRLPGNAENRRTQVARILGGSCKSNTRGDYLAVHCWFADPPPFTPEPAALRLLMAEVPSEVADAEQWLFLDTETTGVAGGTGTYAFLIGLAWWESGGLEIEQLFLREYAEEHAVLEALAERLAERKVLVTFNGKCFDWPLLETRYRMSRQLPVPALRAHLDFLHPARSLWRLRLRSLRLSELERHVLGRDRDEDIFSGLIPQMYLDFIRGGSPERLVPIFHHNQMDLRGLAALSTRILCLLADPEAHGQDALELFGVSRICERRGENARARRHYEKSIAAALPVATDRAARSSLARLAKRDRDFAHACELWKSMLGNSRQGYEAYEQLAIYYEHQARDARAAWEIVQHALAELGRANASGAMAPGAYLQMKRRFEHRLSRLDRKNRRNCEIPYLLPEPGR